MEDPMRTAPMLALLVLGACDAEAPLDTQLPPPVGTALWVGNVVNGEEMPVVVEGANPFDTIQLYGSAVGRGAGPCPPQFGGLCLDIRGARLLSTLVADGDGRAEGVVDVPDTVTVPNVTLQAVSGGWINSYSTNVVQRQVFATPPQPISTGLTLPPVAPYTLEGIDIEGDTLFVDVSYSGGCADHTFTAQWAGVFAESIPEQASVIVNHQPVFDPCDAILFETLRFDLGVIRDEASTRPIQINVGQESALFQFL
jgi:hypothetical protein